VLLDKEELSAWRGMLRAHAGLTRELDAELTREHDLPLSSYEVLLFLADAEDGRMRMSELADSVLLSRSGLTRLVDRLERQGLLKRERCESDARGLFAEITPEGRRVFDAARHTHLDGVRKLFLSRFSRAELRALGALWQKLD
jgi:DNA-binding MarR family transcriptional regulator